MSAPQQPGPGYPPPAGYQPGPPVPPGYELRKKKSIFGRWWFWLAVVLVVVIIAVAASSGGSKGGGGSSASDKVEVVYTVESDAPTVSVTYTTLNGGNLGQEQTNNAPPPFSKTLEVEDSFLKSFTMTASTDFALDGTTTPPNHSITCRITVDGKVVAEQTSTGQAAIVTCAGS
jgi:hypothetical protein